MEKRIMLSLAHMSGREQDFIKEAFDTNWVVPLGPNVDAFEADLENYLRENRHIVALNTGTSALHLGLVILGVQAQDEVICQSFTFAASANPITYLGAKPVFVDSEKDTWNMDPKLLEVAIKDRLAKTGKLPKAIIPVHLFGMPAKMKEILAISEKYNIPILEDSAEALGSKYNGRMCGTLGELAALSFNGNKMITTSGGGALICSTEEQARLARFYATQARDVAPYYQHTHIGYNYRMSNICAGIGRGQMYVLDDHVARRRAIHSLYVALLSDLKGVTVMQNPSAEFHSNFWLSCILVNPEEAGVNREDLRLGMDAANIETRLLWKPMHLQPVFSNAPSYSSGVCENLFNTGLCLPSGPTLTDEDIVRVVDTIKMLTRKCKRMPAFRQRDLAIG
jgi:dTDP-4-amino-4,6-dideoxygalactose transaminase